MQNMIDFSVSLLGALSDFLVVEPMIYFVGMFLLLYIVKAFKVLISS